MDLRYRQIHLDFHTSPIIKDIGLEFDAEEFAERLVKAHVDSITCFARCHHGMLYFDSKLFPERVHPGLADRSLLKEQIAACRKRGIRVPVYTTVQWDEYTVKEHPEWLALEENGAPSLPSYSDGQSIYDAGFYSNLCMNSPYRDFLKAHTKEILEMLDPVDGLFFDIVFINDCSCRYCREDMQKKGYNPVMRKDRFEYAKWMKDEFVMDMSSFVRKYDKDCSIFFNRGHIGAEHRSVVDAYTHFELESLPSGSWGYMHFPVTIRYARNLGLDCLGMTGKFHTEWGDFHSFKNQAALEYECFRMLALNAKCSIGDQLEPNGKLSEHVYDLIGNVYSQVEQKEPWCRGASAVTDIGVFTQEEFYSPGNTQIADSMQGVARMLTESGHQFDVIDSKSDFARYKVLVMPDEIPVSPEFAENLKKYIGQGGAVIASFESGIDIDKKEFVLKEFGVTVKKEQTVDMHGQPVRGKAYPRAAYADYLLPHGVIAEGLPETEHVMYMKGLEVEALPGTEILADVVLPYFNRTWEHFCSHRQAPSSGRKAYAGIVKNGGVVYFSHPIFKQYNRNAPKWCKKLFLNALNLLLPQPVVRHEGPTTLMVTVNEQKEQNRWIVHLLHYIPERRCQDMDIIEDVIPLYNVRLSIKVDKKVQSLLCVPEGRTVDFIMKDGRVEFSVPEITGHQMIAIYYC